MLQLNEDPKRQAILKANRHLLIMGGPGSGKTTIALYKAQQIVESGLLNSGQKVLFLSFARATISRVEEQAENLIFAHSKEQIEINTYHGFFWNIIKHHGYLLTKSPIRIVPPHEASQYLFGVGKDDVYNTLKNLFDEKGLIHFDLFAPLCTQLLTQSGAIRNIIRKMYPIIILDEFQDTNLDEWEFIKLLGEYCRLIALADPDQRIYDFRGADPKRVTQLIELFQPDIFDFGKENNRSNGTDIVLFGNDLLSKTNHGKQYQNVSIQTYSVLKKPNTHLHIKYAVLQAINRLNKEQIPEWSIAVLVPTNALMLDVSDTLLKKQTLKNKKVFPSISHEVAIETAGPSLACLFVAGLLDGGSINSCTIEATMQSIINHVAGRHGSKPVPKKELEFVSGIENYLLTKKIQGKNRKALIDECSNLVDAVNEISFSGNIIADWKMLTGLLEHYQSDYLRHIENDAKYIRLLQRGTQLYSSLDGIWRETHTYKGAVDAVSNALTQEHFAMSTRKWNGVNVMTIHKAKGKEFNEVIIYEGVYQNRIVSAPERIDQARLNLRVAVTRAKKYAVILTPENDPCPLI